MSDVSFEMKVPLDRDGFLRRECPNCERQFKQKHTDSNSEPPENTDIECCYCPYCYISASQNSLWTKEQLEYAQQLYSKEKIEPELRNLQRQIQSLNHHSNIVQVDSRISGLPEPSLLSEIDDMVKVDFPCHPEELLKIDEIWEQDVACFVCGILYPISLIKELPE